MTRTARPDPFIPRWFILAALLITFIPAMSFFLNHSVVRGMLLQRLKTETGIEVTSVRIRLLPRLKIDFSGLAVRNDRHPESTLRVSHGSLTLRILPLFKQQLAIVKVVAMEPQVVVRRDREGQWHVPWTDGPATAEAHEGGVRFRWLLPDLQFAGGDILIVDEHEREVPYELRIQNVHLLLDSHLLRRQADLTLTGDVGTSGERSGISLAGSVSIGTPSPATAAARAAPPVRFEGDLHLTQFDLAPWIAASAGPVFGKDRSWQADMTAQVLVVRGAVGYDASFAQVETRLSWLALRGQGRIQDLGTERPIYSATLSASPVTLETLGRHLPPTWIPPTIRGAVAEHELTGTLELESATLSGLLDEPERGDWNGVAKLSKGSGRFGPSRTPIKNLSGSVFFNPMQVEAMNLSGGVGALLVSNGKLILSHLDLAPALDLQLTGTGKTRDLLVLLQAVSGAGAGERVLNAITAPKGEVQLSIHVAGPLAGESSVELVNAEVTGHDIGARVPDWNLRAEQVDGTVRITPRFIEFRHVHGTVGPVRFDVQGALELGATPHLEDVTVEMSSEAADLMRLLGARAPVSSDLVLDGFSHATVRLSGPVSSPRGTGRIDLTQLDVVVPPVIKKRRGVVSSLEFEGSFVTGKRITASRMALQLPSGRVEGRANVHLGKRPDFKVDLNMAPLSLARLADGFAIGPAVEGVLGASLSVTGRSADPKTWITSGWIELERGVFMIEGLQDRLRDVSGRIRLAGHDAMVERVALKTGDSDLALKGMITQWMDDPTFTIMLESSKLDVTRLLPADDGAPRSNLGLQRFREWALSGHADVTAVIEQAQYHRLQFTALSGHLRVESGRVELSSLIGKTLDGTLSGRLLARVSRRPPIDLEGEWKIDGMPVHQLLSVFDKEQERLKGTLSLTGAIHATVDGVRPMLETMQSLDPLRVRIERGRILHGTVLPKVLRILNLPVLLKGKLDFSHDGIPFDTISATVTMNDGLWTSRNLVFDSPIMKISGAGTLNVVADELDVALAVSPLGAYSDLIGKIPLFGTLLAGDRPGLTTALFEVKGPPSDPDVRYLPFESIGKGLTGYPRLAIDVLTNVLTLPQQLLTPDLP